MILKLAPKERLYVREKTDNKCWFCGGEMSPSYEHPFMGTYEHLLPRSRGGGVYDLFNIAWSHLFCNAEKDNMTVDEYRSFKGVEKFYGEGGEPYDPVKGSEGLFEWYTEEADCEGGEEELEDNYDPELTSVVVSSYNSVAIRWSNGVRLPIHTYYSRENAFRAREKIARSVDLRKITPRSLHKIDRLRRKFSMPRHYSK